MAVWVSLFALLTWHLRSCVKMSSQSTGKYSTNSSSRLQVIESFFMLRVWLFAVICAVNVLTGYLPYIWIDMQEKSKLNSGKAGQRRSILGEMRDWPKGRTDPSIPCLHCSFEFWSDLYNSSHRTIVWTKPSFLSGVDSHMNHPILLFNLWHVCSSRTVRKYNSKSNQKRYQHG